MLFWLSALEIGVLVLVSGLWVAVVVGGLTTGAGSGRDPVRLAVLCAALMTGMVAKLGDFAATGTMPSVFWLYALAFVPVFADMRLAQEPDPRKDGPAGGRDRPDGSLADRGVGSHASRGSEPATI